MVNIKKHIKAFLFKQVYPHRGSSEEFVKYIKRGGGRIGKNTFFFDPAHTVIDDKRLSYLSIGSNCCITKNVQFLNHDYSWSVLRKSHKDFLPDAGRYIEIGDNVFIGWNCIIIGDVKIGDNVIIGANSVVTKDIPSNSVCAGSPARVICTLDDYYKKKESERIVSACKRIRHIEDVERRPASSYDMGWFAYLYMKRTPENCEYLRKLPFHGDDMEQVIANFMETDPFFDSFEELHKLARNNREK